MKISYAVKIWLLTGLVMLLIQIIVGGITRLTGSGLSITKWEIVTGTLPPMTDDAWNTAFDLYRNTPQYQKINQGMSLKEFKFIYFWEYVHRLWARLMGFIFVIPFAIFLYRKLLPRWLTKDLLIVVLLAALAASFGWIMVASGLQDRPWVNAYKLSLHLLIGFYVFCYLLWTCFKVWNVSKVEVHPSIFRMGILLTVLIIVQIVFGGWMSGMKAALFYPNWPDINGDIFPHDVFNISNWTVENFIHYDRDPFAPLLIQFLHRNTAYLLTLIGFIYAWKLWKNAMDHPAVKNSVLLFIILLIIQVLLGIFTLLNSVGNIPLSLGVMHQAGGLLFLSSALLINFQLIRSS